MEQTGNRREQICRILEGAALFAVLYYCCYLFLRSSTFRFVYGEIPRRLMPALVGGLGAVRLGLGLWKDYSSAAERKEKTGVVLKGLCCAAAMLVCVILWRKYDYKFLVYLPFAAFCLYGTEPEKALKWFTACIGTALAATVLCALSGSIRNLLYLRSGTFGKMRGSYGICYPTDFASYLVYLLLFTWCWMKRRKWGGTILIVVTALGMAWGIYALTDSATSTTCAILIAAAAVFDRLRETVLDRKKGTKWIGKVADGLSIGAFPIFGAVFLGLTWLYGQGNAFAVRLNTGLSERLNHAWNAIQTYGIHAFGALTPQNGYGGSVIYDKGAYQFLDITYLLLLVRYGVIFFLIAGLVWIWMTRKALRTGYRRIALAMAIIAFHSFSEHHFPEINFNLLLVMPLCCFAAKPGSGSEALPEKGKRFSLPKKTLAGWIAAAVTAGAFLLLIPNLLSMGRAAAALKGWRDVADWNVHGENALVMLVYWILWLGGFAAAGIAIWRGLAEAMEKKRIGRGTIVSAVLAVCIFAGGTIWTNGVIRGGSAAMEKQMDEEAGAINTVLQAAEEPVYAGQMEWYYSGRFPGISKRVFSPEELARSGRGSILLEREEDANQLVYTGALYTELTPYTGLFTYDKAVIGKLQQAGYTFTPYCTAEREADLIRFAEENKLPVTAGGGLLLSGEEHPFAKGPYLEQAAGEYEAVFTLQLTGEAGVSPDTEICEVRVSADYREAVLAQRTVTAGEYDESGKAEIRIIYRTEVARGVEYPVFPKGETEIELQKVTWRRTAE